MNTQNRWFSCEHDSSHVIQHKTSQLGNFHSIYYYQYHPHY